MERERSPSGRTRVPGRVFSGTGVAIVSPPGHPPATSPEPAMSDLRPVRLSPLVLAFAGALLAACGSGSDSDAFVLRTTSKAATPGDTTSLDGLWMAYLASEAFSGLTDLNGDGDTADDVAVAVELDSQDEFELGVAANRAIVLDDQVYLVVAETEDGVDWNGDTVQDDVVLLHWSKITGVVDFVDVFADAAASTFVVEPRLYYRSASTPVGADETTLRFVDSTQPVLPVAVESVIGGGQLDPIPRAEKRGLLFLTLDEAGTQDLNGDGDMTDANVLALLDGTDAAGRVVNVALALRDGSTPFAAFVQGTSDWTVAFLVDELGQGNTNLNAQGLFGQPLLPESCAGTPDTDTNDQILHYLEFAEFVAGTATPVNTGLVGEDRILILTGFVATVASEADSNCDLNEDGDTSDLVARWVATVVPVVPERDADLMHALATALPGGSFGLSVLQDRLIAVVDEAADEQNIDGKAGEHDLVGWINPAASNPVWKFSHQSPNTPSFGTGVFDSQGDSEPFAGTSWMADESVDGRLGLTFLEEVPRDGNGNIGSLNTNFECTLVAKDADTTDALPVWADFEENRNTLDFDGVGYALDKNNAGIVLQGAYAYFRVSEADDNRDYNADGAKNDVVVMRNPLTTCDPVPMATSNSLTSPVITTGDRAAAFQSSESQAGIDFNDDGDTTDLVVRYFLLP